VISQLCCSAARHSCRSRQERNHMIDELKEPTRTAHSRHLPVKKGHVATMTQDYMRHDTTTLFAALKVKRGTVIGD